MKKSRFLVDETQKSTQNAWDDEKLKGEALKNAENKILEDEKHIKSKETIKDYEEWENFYKKYNTSFFKDRKWIKDSFKCLFDDKVEKVYEIGCGVGNSLSLFENKKLYGSDYSKTAVEHCQQRFKEGEFEQHDITSNSELGYENSFDGCLLIYTLSALDPEFHSKVFRKANKILKTGGLLCFRDYAKLDMVQLRYKPESIISKNFYKRSDGTHTYFFTKEEIEKLAEDNGFEIIELDNISTLLLNRKRNLEMYRVYISGIFRKK